MLLFAQKRTDLLEEGSNRGHAGCTEDYDNNKAKTIEYAWASGSDKPPSNNSREPNYKTLGTLGGSQPSP